MQTRPFFGRYAFVPAYSAPGYAVYPAQPVYYFGAPPQTSSTPQFTPPPPPPRAEREIFYERLHAFRAQIRQPIARLPTLGFKELDLWTLYREVTRRRGIDAVIARKQWKEVAEALRLPSSCTDSGFRLRLHYKKYLEAFERKFFRPPPLPPVTRQSLHAPPTALSPCPSNNSSSARPTPVRRKKRRAPSAPLPRPKSTSHPTSAPLFKQETFASNETSDKPNSSSALAPPADKTVSPHLPSDAHEAHVTRIGSDAGSDGGCSGGSAAGSASTLWSLCAAEGKHMEAAAPVRREHVVPPTSPAESEGAGTAEFLYVAAVKPGECIRRQVDFSVLAEPSLQRYARRYGLQHRSEEPAELARKVSAHFNAHSIGDAEEEARTLMAFVNAVRSKRRRVDAGEAVDES